MEYSDLRAYLSFVRLHSNVRSVETAANDLCFAFITSAPIHDKRYERIENFDNINIDEYSVTRAGFTSLKV